MPPRATATSLPPKRGSVCRLLPGAGDRGGRGGGGGLGSRGQRSLSDPEHLPFPSGTLTSPPLLELLSVPVAAFGPSQLHIPALLYGHVVPGVISPTLAQSSVLLQFLFLHPDVVIFFFH